ncbi:hypothetical protein, partial [Propionibacterium acidifaciens]|uniref:hypothetical protein n=1 Tax=Propionibacterium acidifaciens TaxID=556499 RepID=UPI001E2D468A
MTVEGEERAGPAPEPVTGPDGPRILPRPRRAGADVIRAHMIRAGRAAGGGIWGGACPGRSAP